METPRKDLPNNTKVMASKKVDLPAPFEPVISVVSYFIKSNSVKVFPYERKFFHRILDNFITPTTPQTKMEYYHLSIWQTSISH